MTHLALQDDHGPGDPMGEMATDEDYHTNSVNHDQSRAQGDSCERQ